MCGSVGLEVVIFLPSVDFRLLQGKKERVFFDLVVKRSSIHIILQLLIWNMRFPDLSEGAMRMKKLYENPLYWMFSALELGFAFFVSTIWSSDVPCLKMGQRRKHRGLENWRWTAIFYMFPEESKSTFRLLMELCKIPLTKGLQPLPSPALFKLRLGTVLANCWV